MTKRAASAAVVIVLAVLTGCGPAQPVSGPPSALPDALPNEVSGVQIPCGRIDDAVARIDGLVGDLMKKTGVPGMAVAVVHGGKTVYAKGFGVKDEESSDAKNNGVDPATVFQLASVSKSISSTVVAQQVSANAIGWDTPIVSKLPWFALSDPAVTQMVR